MSQYKIITDSCIDLPAPLVAELDLEVIPLSFTVDGTTYRNHPNEHEIRTVAFYDLLRAGKVATTSQLNPEDHVKAMTPWLQKGFDILSVSFSGALSGTYQSALIAARDLAARYPSRRIVVLDSLAASMGQGLLLTYAARLRQAGAPLGEVARWIEEHRLEVCHLFTVDDLNHLRRGGRLSAGKAFLGTVVQLKPLLHVSPEGKLVPIGTARGRRHAMNRLVAMIAETIVGAEDQTIYISHGDCRAEAEELATTIRNRIPVRDVLVNPIGPVIGSHSGVGTIAVFYLGNERTRPTA